MPILHDDQTYARLTEIATRIVAVVTRILHASPLVDFDLKALSNRQCNLLSELCFLSITQFEDRRTFNVARRAFHPRPAFQTSDSGALPSLMIGNAQIHGMVDDPVLNAGIGRAKA
ncbi:hypothetical protein [Paracoccus sp. AK26]|uniref:hypothetical protein n=1 Tax=Paracoccus sp. AK26 TaxID=2589076 RepID=UPI0014283078|nr:hypothetical protein [Paracoccus sp. AK26]QIR86483.1 hypothetical protein FIU66_14285 [Paracoccus sp. AK26]